MQGSLDSSPNLNIWQYPASFVLASHVIKAGICAWLLICGTASEPLMLQQMQLPFYAIWSTTC
jgi:hypothetical protein